MISEWVTITLPHACGAVAVNSFGFVIDAPPIFQWMLHKHISTITHWTLTKKGTITRGKETQETEAQTKV